MRELAYLLDLDANGTCVRQHRLARRREEDPSCRASHELNADGFFQVGDGATDGDLGNAIGARGGREAVELDDAGEYGELGGRPQFTHKRTKESDGARIVSLQEPKKEYADEDFHACHEP